MKQTVLEKVFAAAVAGALAFTLAGGALVLVAGPFEGWGYLGLFAAVPAAVLALVPIGGRIACFVLGLLTLAGSSVVELGGPDSPLIVLPFIALCLAGAAVLSELCVRALRRVLRPKPTQV